MFAVSSWVSLGKLYSCGSCFWVFKFLAKFAISLSSYSLYQNLQWHQLLLEMGDLCLFFFFSDESCHKLVNFISFVKTKTSGCLNYIYLCCSVTKSRPALWLHGLWHTSCPSPCPRVCSNSCPLSRWCHPTISPSVVPFSSCLQSFPASRSFPVSWLFVPGGQSIGASVSASVLPVNI